jgi:hypothetical protein
MHVHRCTNILAAETVIVQHVSEQPGGSALPDTEAGKTTKATNVCNGWWRSNLTIAPGPVRHLAKARDLDRCFQ